MGNMIFTAPEDNSSLDVSLQEGDTPRSLTGAAFKAVAGDENCLPGSNPQANGHVNDLEPEFWSATNYDGLLEGHREDNLGFNPEGLEIEGELDIDLQSSDAEHDVEPPKAEADLEGSEFTGEGAMEKESDDIEDFRANDPACLLCDDGGCSFAAFLQPIRRTKSP